MRRLATQLSVLLLSSGCASADPHEVSGPRSVETRIVDGLGEFRLDTDEMWEGSAEMQGEPVKVFLHAYDTDFATLAAYAKRVLSRRPLPDQNMLDDVKRGMESLSWKFKEYHFDPDQIELRKFRVERIVIGKDLDDADIELGINLIYPGEVNQWHLKYFREGEFGSLNWIPKTK